MPTAAGFQAAYKCHGPFLLDFTVSRHTVDLPIGRVEPDRVRTALAKQDTSVRAQMSLQLAELHASANSRDSRTAFGENSFSASSRWHFSTSLSASRRFAFASARVSPCEMAAGTSSTKQVYPPFLAGSNTAVSFTPRECHTGSLLATFYSWLPRFALFNFCTPQEMVARPSY